jgi:hypothetical protein
MAMPKDKKARIPEGFERAFEEFQTVPNVGRATAEDLVRLRVRSVKDLARRDAITLYRAICALDGVRHDPCVIDVFMAAVEYAKTGACKPWWEYTPERKAMLAGAGTPKKRISRSRR